MQLSHVNIGAVTALVFAAGIFIAAGQPSNSVATPPVYVPDYSQANIPLPDGLLAWDAVQKTVDATNGQDLAHFVFTFTNVSPGRIAILSGRGSCSCTTVQLPQTPWLIATNDTGEIAVAINLAGKTGTIFKSAIIVTDKGTKNLMLRVNILPPPNATMSEADRARDVAAAKVDRQAVFKGECVACHAKDVAGKYDGQQLFAQVCAVCHDATPRATMVPDLHNLKDPTNEEFWRAWITTGKPGTLMPAFATSQGGPLDDRQISLLAMYLNATIPTHH